MHSNLGNIPNALAREIMERDRQPAFVSEREFMRAISDLAKAHGWRKFHNYDARKSDAGFPDLVLVKNYVLWLECKTSTGQPTADQLAWGESLLAAGQDYRLVRPKDWPEIVRVLSSVP